MEELIVLNIIPRDIAEHICDEIRADAALQWHTAAARWCWTCQKAAGPDPQRRGYLSKPGNRGCHLVNLHYAQRRRNLQLQPGIILN